MRQATSGYSESPELTKEQYARAKQVFLELCDTPADERAPALARLAASDQLVAREVEGMLTMDARGGALDSADPPHTREREDGARAAPARIGSYRIVRLLGEGGMGRVFEAEQESPRRLVALKIVKFGAIAPGMIRRFTQEAEILARLRHVGIAQIYEAGQADVAGEALPYFAMELVDGPPLTQHAQERGLSARERLEQLIRVCEALHHAHERGVVHRDLKPGNILVDGTGQPKVLDFGVARAAEIAGNVPVTVTMQGQILGTLAYMAPEQAAGDDRIGPETDVYALGAIAYELLTGRPPRDLAGLSLAGALRILVHEPAARAGSLVPALRGDVETIIGKALELEPRRRYGSAAALGADIRRYLENRPISARRAGRVYRARKLVSRHKALALGATATFVTLCAGLAVSIVLGLGERRERNLAQQRETLARKNAVVAAGALVNAALASRESDRPWAGVKQLIGVPRELVGWEARYVARRLPWVLSGAAPGRPEFTPNGGVVTFDPYGMGGSWDLDDPWSGRALVPGATATPAQVRAVALLREPNRVEVLDSVTRAVVSSIRLPANASAAACSRDGKTVVALLEGNIGACYRDGVEILRLKGKAEIGCSINGDFLHQRDVDGTLRLVESKTGKVLHTQVSDGSLRNGMGPSPDLYFFQPKPGCLAALDVRTLAPLWTAEDGIDPGWAYSPDGALIVTSLSDGKLIVRDARAGAVVSRIAPGTTGSLGISEDNSTLVLHGKNGRCIAFDLHSGSIVADFDHGRGERSAELDVSPDGHRAVLRSAAWDLPWVVDLKHPWQDEPAYTELKGHTEWVYHVAVSRDGTMIASAAPLDPLVRVWDAFTGEQIATLERGCDPQFFEAFLAFSSDGRTLAATSLRPGPNPEKGHAGVIAWDLATGQATFDWPDTPQTSFDDSLIPRIGAHLGDVRGLRLSARAQFNPAGDLMARGGRSGFPGPLTLESMPGLTPISTPLPEVFGIGFHPSGKLVACGELGHIGIVEVATGRLVADVGGNLQPRTYLTRRERVYGVAYSPDGTRLAAGAADGSVTIYETEFYQPMLELPPHRGKEYSYVYSLEWTPDGTRLVTASGDKTLRIWDSVSPFARRRQIEAIAAAAGTARGYVEERIAEGADQVWDGIPKDDSLNEAARIAARMALVKRWAEAASRR